MVRQILIWSILFSTTVFAQNNEELQKDSIVKGSQIIKDAKKVVGSENININSFELKAKIIAGETTDVIDEIKVLLSDKVYRRINSTQPTPMTITSIWNKTKYKATAEADLGG